MPHQCTNCGHTFPDGSKEMLSGCPDCGGNKFQFKPSGSSSNTETDSQPTTDSQSSTTTQQPPSNQQSPNSQPAADSRQSAETSTPESPTSDSSPPKTASASGQTSPPETEGVEGDAEVVTDDDAGPSGEAPAQSTARSDVVTSSDITAAGSFGPESEPDESATADSAPETTANTTPETTANAAPEPSSDTEAADSSESNLDELRKELNNQFESIRIVSPGQYELNLMELYDRDEYIISLREDGRYVIEVPDGWGDS